MRTRHLPAFVLAATLTLVAWPSLAEQSASLAEIVQQQRLLQREMDTDVIPLTDQQENVVRDAQREVFALTEGKKSLDDLNIGEKAKLHNALERINSQVKGSRRAEETRQICKRVARTGSQLKETRCASREEWDRVREMSRNSLEKARTCDASGGGTCGR